MRPHPFALCLFGSLLLTATAFAQQPATRPQPSGSQTSARTVTGTIVDGSERSRPTMPGVNVMIEPLRDTTQRFGGVTDTSGRFSVALPGPGAYRLRATFIGYRVLRQNVTVGAGPLALGTLVMRLDSLSLDQLLVETDQVRMQMRGDTLEYRADAFRVNRNATAEDLVTKMPGITIQNGQIQAQGETVRRLTVDGEEFFGNDAAAALRNLPAEAIQSVQVSDRQSDQARLTGFDDGNREKTMNLVTRPNMRNGQFGRVYGGYGTDNRFLGGGTVNVFKGVHRFSMIGLANNVGQQNFAIDDILGVMSGGGGGRGGNVQVVMAGGPGGPGGGMRMGGGGGGGGGERISFSGGPGGGGDFGNFLTGAQNGLTTTGAIGMNYSGRIGLKTRVNGSYFFNGSDNSSDVNVNRQYASGLSQGLGYSETNDAESNNYNHRLNGRVEINFSERDALIFSPRLSLQSNNTSSLLAGLTRNASGALLSQTANDYASDDLGINTGANLVYRKGFAKPGRSVSLNLNASYNSRLGDANQKAYNSRTAFPVGAPPVEALLYDQQIDSNVGTAGLNANLAFTERLGTRGQLQLNYNPGFTRNDSQRDAFLRNQATGQYTRLDSAYTSRYENTSVTQRGGASYQIRNDKWFATAGLNLQHEQLAGDQTFPTVRRVDKGFFSVLPNAQLAYTPSRRGSVRLNYRADTRTPSVTQLQDAVNNANPQQLTSGNPDLRPQYSHNLNLNLNRLDPLGGRSFLVFANLTRTFGYIGSQTFVATRDTVLPRGIALPAGGQFTTPSNLDGFWSARSFLNYGRPVTQIKSNVNLTAGAGYSHTPGTLTGLETITNAYNANVGMTLSSNISRKFDFTTSYNADYFASRNTRFTSLDEQYTRHRGSLRLSWQAWKGLTFTTDATGQYYAGLDQTAYPSTLLLNAGLAYQMLRDERAELKLSVNDLLNESKSLSRTVTEVYVEDRNTQVLGRFIMLTLTYRLRNFGSGAPTPAGPRMPGGAPTVIMMGGPPHGGQ